YAAGQAAIVYQDARHHGIVDNLEPPGFERRIHQVVGSIEERADIATLATSAAEVAFRMAIVFLRQNRAPPGDKSHSGLGGRTPQQLFAAARRRRRQVKAAARQPGIVVWASANPHELIHLVVIRRQVPIADGPRDSPTIALRFGQVEIGITERHAAPYVGFPSPAPNP